MNTVQFAIIVIGVCVMIGSAFGVGLAFDDMRIELKSKSGNDRMMVEYKRQAEYWEKKYWELHDKDDK